MDTMRKILLIDDEPDFTDACARTFADRSYQVVTCSRPEFESRLEEPPDIIILGTMSPAGEAFQLHRWLKGHPKYRDIPLVVIDAREPERAVRGWRREEGMQLEAEFYVSKPVEPAVLLPKIQSLLERTAPNIRVLVTDDHTMVRDGISAVLKLQKDMIVVGEAVNGQESIEKVRELSPDVVLMDIVMPVMSGLEATRRIVRGDGGTRVLILTQYDDEENMFVAKQAGAQGFIPKRAASAELLDGIRAVAGGRYYPPAFAYVTANWQEGEASEEAQE
jgi:DNA-binding NarL/FixJ family response regulator